MPTVDDTLVIETASDPDAAVIWAHGLGADKHDFETIIPMLGLPSSLPVRFIFPNAPYRSITINGGMEMRGWYDIRSASINEQEDADGIRESAIILSSLIDEQLKKGIAASRIVLAGFSQGGAIALYQGIRQSQALAGIIALSSYLPLPDSLDEETPGHLNGMPVFIGHGNQDPIVPIELGLFTRDFLLGLKMDVKFQMYPMGHSVSFDEITDVGTWLKKILPH